MEPVVKLIESIPMVNFAKYGANCWLLSPPCQPYTQGGSRKDDKDERAKALIYLFEHFQELAPNEQPDFILLENVPNFEVSNSRDLILSTLKSCDFMIYEFLLTPTQFGFPNHRRRYFLAAHKKSLFSDVPEPKEQIFTTPFWLEEAELNRPLISLSEFLDEFKTAEEEESYLVPDNYIIGKNGFRFDIVTKNSLQCPLFTKAYGSKHVYGSGPFFQTKDVENTNYNFDDSSSLLPFGLRFFTPNEIAKLHGFPVDEKINQRFERISSKHLHRFPPELSRIQLYKLLGNSLNCVVVSSLLNGLFSGDFAKKYPTS